MWIPKTERAAFLVDNLDLPEAAQYEGAAWEHFQLAHLQDDSIFRIDCKCRQSAWSWLSAAEAVADGILARRSSAFVSINQEEAREKIRYAHSVRNALPRPMRPKLVTDNKLELEFGNGARIISLPSKPPRGKAQFNIYLDEFAHVRDDGRIYSAALPIISKGNGRLRIGSSPMGASGRFWEIYTQQIQPYPGYRRKRTPWWEVQAFCVNVIEARRLAPSLTTFQRVDLFGNDRIKAIYANMPEEDFRQEYEATFVDEATAWVSWAEIKTAQDAHSGFCVLATSKDNAIDRAKQAIDEACDAKIEGVLAAGVDIGRVRNTTELFIGGVTTLDSFPLRLAITLDNCEFDNQYEVLVYALRNLPIKKMLIDQSGLGRHLSENLAKAYPTKVEGVDFTNPRKELLATNAKMLIQQRRTPLPTDRDIAYQIHSVKRKVTASKNFVFDTERNEKHHADKFWGWALMLSAAKSDGSWSVW